MLNRKTLSRINDQPKQADRLLPTLIGAGSLALTALLFVLTSSLLFALATIAAGVLSIVVTYRAQKAKLTTALTYGELQGELMVRFSAVQEGCEALSSSEKIWRLSGPIDQRTARSVDAALPPAREPARVGLLETPGISTNVAIWGIEAGEHGTVFFFPEAVLLYRDGRYEGFSYESPKVSIDSAPFYEREEAPEDAQVLAKATVRSRMPVVLYTLLELGFPRGPEFRLQVSSQRAAARFAKAFGVESRRSPRGEDQAWAKEQPREPEENSEGTSAYHDTPGADERTKIASAYATLGVRKGAPMGEIGAAYKKLARAHHPDRVASLSAEDREASERRMKEINAAYTALKQTKRNLAR